MLDLAYYLSFLITSCLCLTTLFFLKSKVKSGFLIVKKAKLNYFIAVAASALLGGAFSFIGLIWLIEKAGYAINYGHGEIFASVLAINVIIGILFLLIGNVVFNWQKQKW